MGRPFSDQELTKAILDTHHAVGRVLDRCPSEVATLAAFVSQRVSPGNSQDASSGTYIAAGLRHDFSALHEAALQSPDCASALNRLLDEYRKVPTTSANRIRESDDEHSIMGAVFVGLLLGSILVGAYCIYKANTE